MKIIFLCAICSCIAAGAWARDWKKYPAVIQLDTSEDIFAIGDAHSDYEHLERAMRAAGIIAAITETPEATQWTAGKALLVSTGDMVDKGPRAHDVLRLYRSLREQARRAGGDVVILAGNHEAEFLAKPAAPKGADFANEMRSIGIDPATIAACKGEFGEFLCSLSFGARIGKWYFSHGGYTAGRTIAQLEADVELGFEQDGYNTKQLVAEDSLLRAELSVSGKGGKPWLDWEMPGKDEKQVLRDYTSALGVEHIVEGHVPSDVAFADGIRRNRGEMFQRFGMLFLIDTGMSRGVNDSDGAVLRITSKGGEKTVAICPDGTETPLWDAKLKQDVGRARPCGR